MPKAHATRWSIAIVAAVALLAVPVVASAATGGSGTPGKRSVASPFDGDGMWIWIASKAAGGDADAIAARAKASGIETIFLKSGDGTSMWSQFSPGFVSALKARGLKVCGWQYVYGRSPAAEARVSARAVKNGAQCFVIDAESEYEGKYRSALTYIRKLRALVGPDYPIGLAAFPYVDYHPGFPYSVFMGPGGAQYNAPQMYWRAIGVSVSSVYSHTYLYNRPYGRPIFPLGQVYMNPNGGELNSFRSLATVNGATGVSWWDWQSAKPRHWKALAKPLVARRTAQPVRGYPTLAKGARGDLVLWAQEHLIAAGQSTPATGYFRAQTAKAVGAFRAAHGLPAGTTIDTATWAELLKFTPDPAAWLRSGTRKASSSKTPSGPPSAKLPALHNELARH